MLLSPSLSRFDNDLKCMKKYTDLEPLLNNRGMFKCFTLFSIHCLKSVKFFEEQEAPSEVFCDKQLLGSSSLQDLVLIMKFAVQMVVNIIMYS